MGLDSDCGDCSMFPILYRTIFQVICYDVTHPNCYPGTMVICMLSDCEQEFKHKWLSWWPLYFVKVAILKFLLKYNVRVTLEKAEKVQDHKKKKKKKLWSKIWEINQLSWMENYVLHHAF